MARTLVWFRGKDLRLADHEPLHAALGDGEAVLAFVLDPYFFEPVRARELPHRMQFLLESLAELEQSIRDRGGELLLVGGHSVRAVPALAEALDVDHVVAHRWMEPFGRRRDERVTAALAALPRPVSFELFEGETLLPPGSLRNASRAPFSVFSAFARAHRSTLHAAEPLPAPIRLPRLPRAAASIERALLPTLDTLGISRNERLLSGGERAARERLSFFVDEGLSAYAERRDLLAENGTSRLSADLKFGTLSVRAVHTAVNRAPESTGKRKFQDELLWREFSHSTLWDRPELLERPFRADFEHFSWRFDERLFDAWRSGRTGYPVIDAAARQLLAEGFVPNRARMIAASFLTKHLLVDYRRGEAHYLKYLTDGDYAQNNLGWQWSAGTGTDAQPYFRVFNPVLQSRKFDPNGDYLKRWVPELGRLSSRHVHAPWEATPIELASAGVRLGDTYPERVVQHESARARFLAEAAHMKDSFRQADDAKEPARNDPSASA